MHVFFTAAQPYLIALAGVLFPGLTLLYARRDKHKDETKTAGQQFVDNIVQDNTGLRAEVNSWRSRAEKAEAELRERDTILASHGTNAPEMFAMMAVPGAMGLLRAHRDRRNTTAS